MPRQLRRHGSVNCSGLSLSTRLPRDTDVPWLLLEPDASISRNERATDNSSATALTITGIASANHAEGPHAFDLHDSRPFSRHREPDANIPWPITPPSKPVGRLNCLAMYRAIISRLVAMPSAPSEIAALPHLSSHRHSLPYLLNWPTVTRLPMPIAMRSSLRTTCLGGGAETRSLSSIRRRAESRS